jgi:rhodanese-related sulfurtransferase
MKCYFYVNISKAIFFNTDLKENRIFDKKIKIMDLTQKEWVEQLQNDPKAVILDVRTEDEWNEGYIPNAINIDIYKGQGFIYKIEELDKTKNYYVYCKAGGRSSQACSIMNQLGFENAYNLIGGFMNWQGEVVIPE